MLSGGVFNSIKSEIEGQSSILDENDVDRVYYSKFEMILILTLLEDTREKLLIIKAKMPKSSAKIAFPSLKQRFEVPLKTNVYDPNISQAVDFCKMKRRELKLSREINLLDKVICIIRDEIKRCGTSTAFETYLRLEKEKQEEETKMNEAHRYLKDTIQKVKIIGKVETSVTDTRFSSMKQKVIELKAERDKMSCNVGLWMDYAREYESARDAQNKLQLTFEEKDLNEKRNKAVMAVEQEKLINKEIIKFYNLSISILDEKIHYWTEAHRKDLLERDVQMTTLRQDQADQAVEMMELLETYQRRETEIQDYMVVRERRRKMEETEQKLNRMATRIQAWWRGTMVRWELGPFFVKEKKKKKKKGGRKKKQ